MSQQPQNREVNSSHLQYLLRHHETSLRLSDSGRLLIQGLSAVAGFALLVVALDHTLSTGLSWLALRTAGVLLALAGLAIAGLILRTIVRHVNARFVARDLERARGVAHNALLNWLLVRENQSIRYAVPTGAVQAEAELTQPTGEVAPRQVSRMHWSALSAVFGAWLIFSLITPKEIAPSLRRLFGSTEQAPSATQIVLVSPKPENAVYAGEPLTVEFEIRGKSADGLSFDLIDPAANSADSRPLVRHNLPRAAPRGKPDLRSITLTGNEIAGDLHFRARAGDAELSGRIAVRPIPDVAGYDIEVTPPAYLGLPPATTKAPELHAYAGSSASWRVSANCEILSPVFVFKGATETRTRMSVSTAEPRVARVQLPLTESGAYWIEFADAGGRAAPRGSAHRIVLQGDQAPRVELVEPTAAARVADTVDLADAPWLRVAASDDWQLRSLELVLERSGVIERRDLSIGKSKPGEVVQVGVAGAEIDLAVGQSLKAWFEARDNRQTPDGQPASQLGRSPILTLRRSSASAIERGGNKAEPEVAQAEPGTMVETASSKKKTRGSGQGNDDTATGDGPGDNPSDTPGPEGGSAHASDKGTTATTDQPADPNNSANVGQEAGPDQSGAGNSDSPAGKNDGDGKKGENETGKGDGDGEMDGDGQGGDNPPMENEQKKFIERHGDEVKQAKEALDRKNLNAGNSETSAPPRERETSDESDPSSEMNPSDQNPQPPPNPTPQKENENKKGQAGSPEGEPNKDGEPTKEERQSGQSQKQDGEKPSKEGKPDPGTSGKQKPEPGQNDKDSNSDADKKNEKGASDKDGNKDKQSADKGQDSSQGDKSPGKDADAPKPQPNAPANDKSKPESPDPESGKSDQADANPQAGQKGDPSGGPAADDLPEDQRDNSRTAAPGAVSLPGGKTPPEPSESPGAPIQDDGPISKESADAKSDRPRNDIQNLLELLERSETIGPEALDDLPWPAEKKAAFLRDLKRLDSLSKLSSNQAAMQRWREGKPLGTRDVQLGTGTGASGAVGDSTMQADSIEKIANPPDQKVPPHLRPVLDAYYRSLANQRTSKSKPADSRP